MVIKKEFTQLDFGGVLRSVHDFPSSSLRVINGISSVPSDYSSVNLTYNSFGSVTKAQFIGVGIRQEVEIRTIADVGGSLNNKYILLYPQGDYATYYFWFNVSGGGTDPAVPGATGIEIPLVTNDSAAVVALALGTFIKVIQGFKTHVYANVTTVTNTEHGPATVAGAGTSGFTIQVKQLGDSDLVKEINIPYDGKVKYVYNEQERKFEIFPINNVSVDVDLDAETGDNIAISRHANPVEILLEVNKTPGQLLTTSYTEIFSHTSSETVRLRVIKVKADTFGTFRVKVDGTVKDYYQTSPFNRNCFFVFSEDLDVSTGGVLKIEFIPDRIQGVATYNFFMRSEGYKV